MIKKILLLSLVSLGVRAADIHIVEYSSGSQNFVITGQPYTAASICGRTRTGDRVVFIQGSNDDPSPVVEIYNIRSKKTCRLVKTPK